MTVENLNEIDFSQIDFDALDEDQKDALAKLANEQLRTHSKKVEDENSNLRKQVMKSHLTEIGLNDEEGLGKAIAKEYQGEYTVDAIRAYAESEYGHTSEPATPPAAVTASQRQDQLQSQSDPVTPQPKPDPAAEAAAKMHDPEASRQDAQRSIAAKVVQFSDQHYGTEGPTAPPPESQ